MVPDLCTDFARLDQFKSDHCFILCPLKTSENLRSKFTWTFALNGLTYSSPMFHFYTPWKRENARIKPRFWRFNFPSYKEAKKQHVMGCNGYVITSRGRYNSFLKKRGKFLK